MRAAPLLQLGFVLAAAVAVYSFVSAAKDGEARRVCAPLCHLSPSYAGHNRVAPDFELPSLDHGTVRLSDFRGKTVILNFWTKTCRPCLEEMPALAQLARSVEGRRDIAVVTVSTDESADDVRGTLQSVLDGPPGFVTLIDPDAKVVTGKYGTKLFPETWFVDPGGVIRARVDGPRDWAAALTIDFARTLGEPFVCDVEVAGEGLRGRHAGVCEEA